MVRRQTFFIVPLSCYEKNSKNISDLARYVLRGAQIHRKKKTKNDWLRGGDAGT